MQEGLTIRKALEGWPLLAETPTIGGSTSRFVDTSIERFELAAASGFDQQYALFVNGRELPFRSLSSKESIAGLRYRKSALYPSLHPQIGVQLPLSIVLVERETDRIHKLFRLTTRRHSVYRRTAGRIPNAESLANRRRRGCTPAICGSKVWRIPNSHQPARGNPDVQRRKPIPWPKRMKQVVITGVSTGIGYATAKVLLDHGFRVFGSVRNSEDASSFATGIG